MKGWRFDRGAWESALLPQRSYVRNVGKIFAELADGEGLFSGSQGEIAKSHKVTRRELSDAIDVLKAAGLLEVVTPGSRPSRGRQDTPAVWRLKLNASPVVSRQVGDR